MFVLAAEAATESFPTWVPPLIGVVFFAFAALIVFSFRDVANRHREKPSAAAHDEHGHEAQH